MKKNNTYRICVVQGVEGPSIYLNDFRIAGPKPWGGGSVIYEWEVGDEDLDMARMTPKQLQNHYKKKK